MGKTYAVEMEHIVKSFGGVQALKDVSFSVKEGSIHALVGENGAGKSTLMKILSGAYAKDEGEIRIFGKKTSGGSTTAMKKAGVGIIYQEFALASDLTVAENIFINRLTLGGKIISWKKLYKEAGEIIQRLGFDIDPKEKVERLSVAYQQIVEIAKALGEDAKVLVLDEPTAVLSPYETEKLFVVLRHLKEQGTSIIYISHRLDEVFELSDEITVLRDGAVVNQYETKKTNMNEVVSDMLGRNMDSLYPKRDELEEKEVILKVSNLNYGNMVRNVNFTVHKGEIFGIAGLVGSGKTETARAIFGADGLPEGEIILCGKPVRPSSPHAGVKQGIGYLSENRKEEGVLLEMTIQENMTMASMKKVSTFGVFGRKRETICTNQQVQRLGIKTDSIHKKVGNLSGGNQQKVALAKWLNVDSEILFLDEPTRGVDIGAKLEIYSIIDGLAKEGKAIVLLSSELEEICGLCDRVLVMHKGTAKGILNRKDLTKHNIINMAVDLELETDCQEAGGLTYDEKA